MFGERRQRHQQNQWLDDLTEWTNLTLPEAVSYAMHKCLFTKLSPPVQQVRYLDLVNPFTADPINALHFATVV